MRARHLFWSPSDEDEDEVPETRTPPPARPSSSRRLYVRKQSHHKVSEGDVARRVDTELRTVARELCALLPVGDFGEISAMLDSVLEPWISSGAFNAVRSCARAGVVRALRKGIEEQGELRSRLLIARDALRTLGDLIDDPEDAHCELAATRAIFEASVSGGSGDELLFEHGLVPLLVAKVAKRLRDDEPLKPIVYAAAALENLGATDTSRLIEASGGMLTCALCDLLRCSLSAKRRRDRARAALLAHAAGALRNVCGDATQLRQFESGKAVDALALALGEAVRGDSDGSIDWKLTLNVARALAKLSEHKAFSAFREAGREELLEDALRALIEAHAQRRDCIDRANPKRSAFFGAIVLRIAYFLGNATADNASSRRCLGLTGIDDCIHLLVSTSPHSDEQIAIKLIRLIANCIIDPSVGARAAASTNIACIAGCLTSALERNREELALNAASALANLSYYDTSVAFDESTCCALVDLLLHPNHETVAEAARAFGNLSRHKHLRALMHSVRADEALGLLLAHPSRDVVFGAAGALVNLALDPHASAIFQDHDAPAQLVQIVRRAGVQDLPLAAVACKALYNWLLHHAHRQPAHMPRLSQALDLLIDATQHTFTNISRAAPNGRSEDSDGDAYRDFLAAARALLPLLARPSADLS